jgi:hypothetical protein
MFNIQEEKFSSPKKLFIGITALSVSKMENELKEGEYNRIDFYLENKEKEVFVKKSFFLRDEEVVSKTGKKQYINSLGQANYFSESPEQNSYFEIEGARPALRGEAELTSFIRALFNVKKDKEGNLDNPSALANGNMDELNDLMTKIGNRKVIGCLQVKDGKYQDLHNSFEAYWDTKTEFKKVTKEVSMDNYNKSYPGVQPYPFKEYTSTEAPQPTKEADMLPKEAIAFPPSSYSVSSLKEAFPDQEMPF